MATLLLRRRRTTERKPRLPAHPKVKLVDEHGRTVTLPYASTDLDLGNVAPSWEELDRPGRKPLLASEGLQLRRLRGTFTVGYPDHQRDVEQELHMLRLLARDGVKVRWDGYGPSEHGWWVIEDYQQRVSLRQHGTNRITRAEVTLTLAESAAAKVSLGPLTGGAKARPAKPAGQPEPDRAEPRSHTVAAGETLYAIAQRYYGDGSRWPEIAEASGVRDPRKLQVGQKLTIP